MCQGKTTNEKDASNFVPFAVAAKAIRPRARLPGRHAFASPPTMHPLSGHMASGRRLVSRAYGAVGPKLESPSVDARLVVVEKTLVLCRVS
ncbi:hypothetical protein L1887_61930 [Cichorium endivia]|nr:hypothetical protein L1887_61930 [Cichorium endivia]